MNIAEAFGLAKPGDADLEGRNQSDAITIPSILILHPYFLLNDRSGLVSRSLHRLLAEAGVMTVAILSLASPVHAQSPVVIDDGGASVAADQVAPTHAPAAQGSGDTTQGPAVQGELEDIVVTAQRRSETLQSVPIAVSAFGSKERDRLNLRTAQDLVNFTPGASLSQVGLSIRGVGRYTTVLGSDAGVAIYTDGFYSVDPGLLGQSTLFVDRVEILRGPQGTLFGRNSIGGSANIVSKRPSGTTGGEFRVGGGNYNTWMAGGTFTGPVTETLHYRIGGLTNIRRDGYIKNLAPGRSDLLDQNQLYAEAQLEWDVTPNLNAWVKYSHTEYDQSPSLVTSPVLASPYFTGKFFPAASLVPAAGYDAQSPNPGARNIYTVSLDDPGRSKLTGDHRVVGQLSWNAGPVTLKYTGGFQVSHTIAEGDYDSSARASYVVRAGGPDLLQPAVGTVVSSRYLYTTGQDTKYSSHELTLNSNGSGRFDWIVGGNYYKEYLRQPYLLRAPDVAALAQPIYATPPYPLAAPNPDRAFYSQYGSLRTESIGGFAQGNYKFSDQFGMTAGVRYTHDRKIGTELFRNVYWNPVDGGLISPTCCSFESTPTVNSRRVEDSWGGVTARLALNWQPDKNTLGYASYSRGYKSGGFQLGQIAAVAEVNPEHVNAYEVGLKKTLGQFRVNVAGFYYDYSDYQVPITILRGGGIGGAITQSQFVNAKRARSYGGEVEARWQPSRAFQLIANYSYLNAKSSDFCCVLDIAQPTVGNQDLSGNDLPQSPHHKVSVGASYGFELPFGTLVFAGTDSYVSKQYYSPFTTARYLGEGYNLANFTATLYGEGGVEVAGYVRNAFNKRYIYGLTLGPASVNSPRSVAPGDPRTYGMEVRFKF